MITIESAKAVAVQYLEGHAADLGRYVVQAIALWIKNRKHAERIIQQAHDEYVAEMDAIAERMKGEP